MPHILPHIGNSAPHVAIYVDTHHLVLTCLVSILSLARALSLSLTRCMSLYLVSDACLGIHTLSLRGAVGRAVGMVGK
jgi:hypothetical protein